MSNPRNLQELADALAEQAHTVRQQASNPRDGLSFRSHKIGYADALLDTRATVLAMIAQDHPVFADLPNARGVFAMPATDALIESLQDEQNNMHPAVVEALQPGVDYEPSVCPNCGRDEHTEDELAECVGAITEPYDVVGAIMAFEEGEMDEDETIHLFQHLVDTGLAWQLQGSYGRMAMALIEQGLVTR